MTKPKRKPKRIGAPKVEAWAVWDNPPAPGDSGREGFQSELHASKGDAYEVANRYDAGACRVVRLVPTNPRADAVVRAAIAWTSDGSEFRDETGDALRRAVEALDAKKPKK